ncbi:MAG: sulfite exporter TauE/SafE family protein [Candidatus Izemoplasmataceae bacterium]
MFIRKDGCDILYLIVYFLIAVIATILGSIAGLGGGVIIKPVLDFYGRDALGIIGALSSITVFSMSIMTLYRRLKAGISLKLVRISILSLGSIFGGVLGIFIFDFVILKIGEDSLKLIQSLILLVLMIVIYVYTLNKDRFPDYDVNNYIVLGLLGVVLGYVASFLGIGGGPINVMILMLVMALNAKEAAIHSIFIIFFAQLSKIIFIGFTGVLFELDVSVVLIMITGGLMGGYLGSRISVDVSNKVVMKIFQGTVLFLIGLNLYNSIAVLV